MADFQILKEADLVGVTIGPPYANQKAFVGNGCVYFPHTTKCWITLRIEFDGEQLELYLDCDYPARDHWLAFEIDQIGLADIFDFPQNGDPVDAIVWMMELGVAPGLPFMVEATYNCWRDYWGEYDCETDWGLLHNDFDPAEHAEAWDDYFREEMRTLDPTSPYGLTVGQLIGK